MDKAAVAGIPDLLAQLGRGLRSDGCSIVSSASVRIVAATGYEPAACGTDKSRGARALALRVIWLAAFTSHSALSSSLPPAMDASSGRTRQPLGAWQT